MNKCNGRDGETCLVAQAAYKRGLAAGVELAKREMEKAGLFVDFEDALRRGGGE